MERSPTRVIATKHKDKRANIPTEELRDFVADDEKAPKRVLYPRDPSLDPQLVWMGKDEQDSQDLEVPAVPIYIQEKVHPQAIIENLRAAAKAGEKVQELALFSDFNGIKFEQLIGFYQHKDGVNWSNFHPQPPLRQTQNRQNRHQSHQPLRRRSPEGLSDPINSTFNNL
jgi:adenine-specific DNA-methyltransferase